MEHAVILLSTACIFGFFMAWGIGANDVANAMGTSVGSRALTFVKATIIAALFESAGAILAGGQVTQTIRAEIIDPQLFTNTPELLAYGMLAALAAAGTWLVIATKRALPVSTTHTIVGALIGFGLVSLGADDIHWEVVTNIALSWIVTPILAAIISFFIFTSIKTFILDHTTPFERAKTITPLYVFAVVFIIAMVTLMKGLKHLHLNFSDTDNMLFAGLIASVCMLLTYAVLRKKSCNNVADVMEVEKIFAILQVITACSMAFAHGANDVANAIGPLAAIVDIVQSGGIIASNAGLPFWVLALGASGIVIGLATYGYKVIATIGNHITELTPSRGFSAELATASTVIIASGLGLPISTTQTLVGAVIGVALARGLWALDLTVVRSIFLSWVITLPAGAALAIVYYYIIKTIIGS